MTEDIEEFIAYLATERGLSTRYQLNIRRSLETLAAWIGAQTGIAGFRALSPAQITRFLADRKRGGLDPATVRLDAVAIRIFFRFLSERRGWESNPAALLSLPRGEKQLPETLREEQVKTLLESVAVESPLGLRDRAILEVLYACGLRVSELCDLRLENTDLDARTMRVTGKGTKTRLVPVAAAAAEWVRRYLTDQRPGLVNARSGAEVFLSIRGRKLTPQRIWQMVRERAAAAGWKGKVHPHLFRHSFATHLLGGGADLRIIQELLGHADIATTQIYTHVEQSGLRAVLKRFHPRG